MTLDCDKWLQDRRPDIDAWWDHAVEDILVGRREYSWPPGTPTDQALAKREELSRRVSDEAARTGALSRSALSDIFKWGFNDDSALSKSTDEQLDTAIRAGLEALGGDRPREAAEEVGRLVDIGVSRSTKIFGLVEPQRFAIYDSRAGNGLGDLQRDGQRMIHIPPGRVIRGTTTNATTLERGYTDFTCLLRYLVSRAKHDGVATSVLGSPVDIEMGLFMRGRVL